MGGLHGQHYFIDRLSWIIRVRKKSIMAGFKSGPGGYNLYLSVRGFTHIYLGACLGVKSVQNLVSTLQLDSLWQRFVVFSLS